MGERYLFSFQELLEVLARVVFFPILMLGVYVRRWDALLSQSLLHDAIHLRLFGFEVLDLGCISFVDVV